MSSDEIFDMLQQTDHAILSKIINGGGAFLNAHERLVYENIVKRAEEIGWTHERVIWALQQVISQ
ncbi:MAG: hypothetical protein HQK99_08965 [Nitrospirae bacterium]|nr:hypothetical protein [Nitrospirota bacterium]